MSANTGFDAFFPRLVAALDRLPGVGEQAARRLARHLMADDQAAELAHLIATAQHDFRLCRCCRMYSAEELCPSCCQLSADGRLLVVEQADELLHWRDAGYAGPAFVLHGLLSPMTGRGPSQLGLSLLKQRVAEEDVGRLLLSLDDSVEARATVTFIAQMVPQAEVQRLSVEQIKQQLLIEKEPG